MPPEEREDNEDFEPEKEAEASPGCGRGWIHPFCGQFASFVLKDPEAGAFILTSRVQRVARNANDRRRAKFVPRIELENPPRMDPKSGPIVYVAIANDMLDTRRSAHVARSTPCMRSVPIVATAL